MAKSFINMTFFAALLLILTIMMCSSASGDNVYIYVLFAVVDSAKKIFTHSFRGSVRDFCNCGEGNDGGAGNDVGSVGP
ncbi:hypothetical protein MKW92_015772 [Papaver armeniacum]|nr:hypothetical protein MKW92_015772 [Papaver armeniacum]